MASVPPENVIVIDDRSLGGLVRTLFAALRTLRRLRPDAVLDCELFARISSLLSWASGAPLRAGFHRHTQEGLYRGSFINRPVLYNPYRHLSLQFLTLARALESGTHPLDKESEDEGGVPAPAPAFLPGEEDSVRRAPARRLSAACRTAARARLCERRDPADPRVAGRALAHPRSRGLIDDGYVVAIDRPAGGQAALQRARASGRASGLPRPHGLHQVGARAGRAARARGAAGDQRRRTGAVLVAHRGADRGAVRAGNAARCTAARRPRELPAPRAALLAVPHRLQPPPLALRRRQPVPQADRARAGAGARRASSSPAPVRTSGGGAA